MADPDLTAWFRSRAVRVLTYILTRVQRDPRQHKSSWRVGLYSGEIYGHTSKKMMMMERQAYAEVLRFHPMAVVKRTGTLDISRPYQNI